MIEEERHISNRAVEQLGFIFLSQTILGPGRDALQTNFTPNATARDIPGNQCQALLNTAFVVFF